MGRRGILFVVMLAAAGLAGWQMFGRGGFDDPTRPARFADLTKPGAAAGYNVLLVTLDTTRPDYLGCYGRKEADTPAIDSLVKAGVRFDDAITPVPITAPSHASIFTGLDPSHHGVRNNGHYKLAPEYVTLAEILKERGYATAAFVACFVLDKRFGFDQGFDSYDFRVEDVGRQGLDSLQNERRADDVSNSAIQWLKSRDRDRSTEPFFLWLHYYDPHYPYLSPLQNLPRFAGKPYDAEIAFMDRQFKRVLDVLDQQGLRKRTLIVVVSDHGESLNEHGESQHGLFIYDATVRVALLFSCPSLFKGAYRVDDRMVGTVDILPTVQELLGLPASEQLDGLSLLKPDFPTDRSLYLESVYPEQQFGCTPYHGLRRMTDKLIRGPIPEYYDLTEDPKELRNLGEASSIPKAAPEQELAEILERLASHGKAEQSALHAITPEERGRLEALGYISLTTPQQSGEPCDIRAKLPLLKQYFEALELGRAGRNEEALAALKEVVAQTEGFATPVHSLADLYAHLGRHEEAAQVLREFSFEHPSADILIHLAELLHHLRRYDEMEEKLQAAEILQPSRGSIPKLRGDRYFQEGRFEEAIQEYEKAVRLDGERVGPEIWEQLRLARQQLQAAPTSGASP